MGEGRRESGIFSLVGLDHPNQLERLEKIRFCAQADFVLKGDENREGTASFACLAWSSGKSVFRERRAS
jgi:hypothetical protein